MEGKGDEKRRKVKDNEGKDGKRLKGWKGIERMVRDEKDGKGLKGLKGIERIEGD